MPHKLEKKRYDTTEYKGRNFEMNISKNKYLDKAEQKEKLKVRSFKRSIR